MTEVARLVVGRVVCRFGVDINSRASVLLAMSKEPEASEITLADANEAISLVLRNVS